MIYDYSSFVMFEILHLLYHGLSISDVMDGCLCLCDLIYMIVVHGDVMWMINVMGRFLIY